MLAAVLALAGCSSDGPSADAARAGATSTAAPSDPAVTPTASPALRWQKLPAPPLSPRTGVIAVAVADRLLVVGGDDGPPCPPNADCAATPAPLRDGAVYDAAAGEWTTLPEAPLGLLNQFPSTVAGDVLYVLTDTALVSFDAAANAWDTHPLPATDRRDVRLAALGNRVAAVAGERVEETSGEDAADEIFDPATDTWSRLPVDPLGPSFDRVLTDTPAGAVLTAKESVEAPGSTAPPIVRAALLDPDLTTWTRLPDSELIGGYRWAWTGERMVDPTLGEADGGAVDNWGRSLPYGGTFDPATQTWGRFVEAPDAYSGGWAVEALGGPVSASGGWLYDDRTAEWSVLTAPDGAPGLPGAAVWVGDTLYVVGGQFDGRSGSAALTADVWALTVDGTD
ncbi:hypothetical protein [Sporichthya brevicatena]|uniref:hypothetical protein n=1 Tax=Sporichthya brevicatena TaxID=171442 RepID=UPI0031D53F35